MKGGGGRVTQMEDTNGYNRDRGGISDNLWRNMKYDARCPMYNVVVSKISGVSYSKIRYKRRVVPLRSLFQSCRRLELKRPVRELLTSEEKLRERHTGHRKDSSERLHRKYQSIKLRLNPLYQELIGHDLRILKG